MPAGADRWSGLLGALSEAELTRYREMAADQLGRETRWAWAHVILALLAVGSVLLSGYLLVTKGPVRGVFQGLLLAGMLAYWPWRSLATQRLWRGHAAAVTAELDRRAGAVRD